MPKLKKPSRKKLVRELDQVFSRFIRARDQRCVICGSTKDLTCGHIFSRIAYSTRWDEENCHCQCKSCNYNHENCAYPFYNWFQNKFGKDKFDAVYLKYNTPRKISNGELADMIEQYK